MQTLLLVVELLIAVALIGVVMLQRSEGGALGMGGGGGGGGFGGLFSPRGAGDALTRTTSILAIAFFVVCIALSLMVRYSHPQRSAFDSSAQTGKVEPSQQKAPAQNPGNPSAPKVPTPH